MSPLFEVRVVMIWKLNTYLQRINDENATRQKDPVGARHRLQEIVAHTKPATKESLIVDYMAPRGVEEL